MKKDRIARIQDLVGLLNALYPPGLAEPWDNVGLQVGDPAAELRRVLVCLDPTDAALAAAVEAQAQAVLAHHPLIFTPLRNLTPSDAAGRVAFEAVRSGVAVLAVHTNLDRGQDGLNDWLAVRLGVSPCQVLAAGGDLLKLVVYVPAGHEEAVAEALFAAGAGRIGRYDRCSFRGEGIGTFRAGEGASPFLGRVGETERAAEIRLETILPREAQHRVVTRLLKAHPYEEVAYDLIPLANQREDIGLGRIGRLDETLFLEAFAARVKESLGAASLRVVGKPQRPVTKVGVVGAVLMVGQLALLFARRLEVPVVLTDLDQERVDRGVGYVDGEIDKLPGKGRIRADKANQLKGLVTGSVDKGWLLYTSPSPRD